VEGVYALKGSTNFLTVNGVATIENFSILGPPDTTNYIQISTNAIDSDKQLNSGGEQTAYELVYMEI